MENKAALNLSGDSLINMIFMFASSRPRAFGVYRVYAAEELDEMLSHYEHDLIDAAENADAEHITRLSQAMYILKTGEFENVWWRVENRANQLASEGKLESYHLVNLVRSFSRAQHNHMVA